MESSEPAFQARPALATAGGIALIGIGAGLGTVKSLPLNVRAMHLGMASLFLLLIPPIIYIHGRRFFRKGAADWVAWTHFGLLAVLSFLAVHMLQRWIPAARHLHAHAASEPVIATLDGQKYDVTDFVPQHPGGRAAIMRASGGDLKKVWRKNGVSWHLSNQRVRNVLKDRKIL